MLAFLVDEEPVLGVECPLPFCISIEVRAGFLCLYFFSDRCHFSSSPSPLRTDLTELIASSSNLYAVDDIVLIFFSGFPTLLLC